MSSGNGSYTNERLDRIEAMLNQVASDHVMFLQDHQMLLKAQVVMQDSLSRLEKNVSVLEKSVSVLEKTVSVLAESQRATDEKLNILVTTVDDWIRRH